MTTRQALLSCFLFSIKQRNTSWRFGMALQQTPNASPMQAPCSSDVWATAVEHKNAAVKAAGTETNALIELAH
jgi:hypothetical protein